MPRLIDDSIGPIGAIISSMLTLAQFQSLHGTGWVLANGGDGLSLDGSGTIPVDCAYARITGATKVPDARGRVLRGKNNGRSTSSGNADGELDLGAGQEHQFASHNHGGGGHTHNTPLRARTISEGGNVLTGMLSDRNDGTFYTPSYPSTGPSETVVDSEGGNETRMRNVTVNHFIRIN